jgi:DME family drug/metabolite transporter
MSRTSVLLASLCFGTTGTAQALGPSAATPLTVGAARIVVGALLLIVAARLFAPGDRDARWPLGPVLAAGAAVAVYQLCFFAAVADTGVAVGTVVALGSAPAIAGVALRVTGGDALTPRWMVATGLACAGVALLVAAGGEGAEVSPPGVLLAVGAGAGYAAFTVASKQLLTLGHSSEAVMARGFGLGAILLLPVLVLGDVRWIATPGGAALALFLGLVPTAIAYVLFARGLRALSPAETATLTLAEPVTATVLGAAVLGEHVGGPALGGIALVLGALVILAVPERRRMAAAAAAAR